MTQAAIANQDQHELTSAERGQLAKHETVIKMNLRGFREVGEALAEIRDKRLYREEAPTFEAYLVGKWGLSRRRGYQLIDAAEAVADVQSSAHLPLPLSSVQAEVLARVPREQRAEVWEQAVERNDGRPAPARLVEQVIAEREAALVPPDPFGDERAGALTFLDQERERRAAREGTPTLAKSSDRPAQGPPGVAKEPGHNEWGTPAEFLESARLVLGGIDLDPASCSRAQGLVRAGDYFTKGDDGLAQPWRGRVWLNPPYGKDEDGNSGALPWVERLVREYSDGNVTAAIACVNALPAAPWFWPLWDFSICFTRQRVRFIDMSERPKDSSPANGTAFIYLGHDREAFIREFGKYGAIVTRLHVIGA